MKFIEHAIERLTIIFGSAVLVMMVLQIVVDVSMRTFADKGLTATSELVSHYYMVMVSFLPVAYSELRRRHVEATIFTDYLNLKKRLVVELFGFVLSVLIYGILCWGTLQEALSNTAKGAYIESGVTVFYTWPSYWILPVSFGLMTFVLTFRVISTFSQFFNGRIDTQAASPNALNITVTEGEK
ncbi:TRAP transporter small permease [Marinomonas mediterranea]|uniref:TRAP transporter small permease protein n=1 Tax=Marinomonas mediterranea (strain ATCC 700492 / JCM 21426 / NBRC 103028 / MMB-1) TaxID=717774 RepID=F2JZQ4_MARM1|nr:TRAP transporter small permease [Marinomonas mediterranea]ADZ90908.1 hypothetical protein Marme_1645 [Marinomonas mediterranea MMB-1]WCN17053.1 TRAP transporter small permease subunit [Marinomonas mediterranea MMB-1]